MSHLRTPLGADDHVLGNAGAAVQVVEYGDYQCPYCAEAYPVVRALAARHGRALAVAFRNFPMTDAHPEAYNAAVVAEFAGQHGQFWAAHDALYDNQDQLGPELYASLVQSLGLEVEALQAAFDSGRFDARIRRDLDGGLRSGVNGTPCFFVNGQRLDVQGDFRALDDVVGQLLQAP